MYFIENAAFVDTFRKVVPVFAFAAGALDQVSHLEIEPVSVGSVWVEWSHISSIFRPDAAKGRCRGGWGLRLSLWPCPIVPGPVEISVIVIIITLLRSQGKPVGIREQGPAGCVEIDAEVGQKGHLCNETD